MSNRSQIPQHDFRAAEADRAEKVFGVIFVARDPITLPSSTLAGCACHSQNCAFWTSRTLRSEPMLHLYEDDESQEPLASQKGTIDMAHIANKPRPKLRKAPQPPLSRPGATPDADRAKKPSLAEPTATDQELTPGDRVEGLGNFGTPTGEFGTVQRANDDDAVVKWDDDGRVRVHQPSLKKV